MTFINREALKNVNYGTEGAGSQAGAAGQEGAAAQQGQQSSSTEAAGAAQSGDNTGGQQGAAAASSSAAGSEGAGGAAAAGTGTGSEGAGASGNQGSAAQAAGAAGSEGAGAAAQGAGTEGAGAAGAGSQEPPKTPTIEELRLQLQKETFEKYGVKSQEELDALFNRATQTPETEEQKKEREQRYQADLDHFAVAQNKLSREEILKLETLNSKGAEDIAYEEFARSYKETHKEASDEAVRDEFRSFYNLDSENAALKSQGQAAIERLAKDVKAPLQSKYDEAKRLFDTSQTLTQQKPLFETTVKKAVADAVPQRLELYKGDTDELSIGFDIPATEIDEVEKALLNDEEFRRFRNTEDKQQASTFIRETAANIVKMRNFDKIIATVRESAYAQGLKAGSTTGAEQPFPLKKTQEPVVVQGEDLTEEDKSKVRGVFGNRNRRF